MCVCVLTWSTYQPVCGPAWFTRQCACVPTCQERRIVSFLRANGIYDVPIFQLGVPIWHTACLIYQLGVPMCQKHANFPIFLLQNAKGNFNTLFLHKKFYIILDIIGYIYKNCIILHFYTSCHIKEKCAQFLFFLKLFCSLVKNENTKRPGFYILLVTRFFKFSSAKTNKQNK